MRKEAAMTGNVALWTDGEVTIVLPHVTAAFWAEEEYEDEDSIRTTPDKAARFVVEAGDTSFTFDREGQWRDSAVSFLRALSLYWETRS